MWNILAMNGGVLMTSKVYPEAEAGVPPVLKGMCGQAALPSPGPPHSQLQKGQLCPTCSPAQPRGVDRREMRDPREPRYWLARNPAQALSHDLLQEAQMPVRRAPTPEQKGHERVELRKVQREVHRYRGEEEGTAYPCERWTV